MIGGPQGSGINVSADVFAKACVRSGLRVFSNIEYHSNIMGRHSYFRVRVNERPIQSHVEPVDLLLALDRETLFGDVDAPYQTHRGHVHRLVDGGGIILDSELGVEVDEIGRDEVNIYAVPYADILREGVARSGADYNSKRHDIMRNMVSVAASFALVGMDMDQIVALLRERLGEHRQDLVELNGHVLASTADFMKDNYPDPFAVNINPIEVDKAPLYMRGADAVALGKVHAGCSIQTYYPIAPATEESVVLEKIKDDYPIIVIQAEDEIACINQAVGAAHAGARASTSTSGPGFALMIEGLGFAAITEAPGPVVCLYQRGGPSTGLPTRGGQTDLRLALQPGHGEFPHILVAPGDLAECFELTYNAFNYADSYHVPVVVLLDRCLAAGHWTIDDFDRKHLDVTFGPRYDSGKSREGDTYRRHLLTESGVSPRSIPGEPGGMFVTTSDEHTEFGKISEGIVNRLNQMDKRMGKLQVIADEVPEEMKWTLHGPADADLTVVAWGSTKGAIIDAMDTLKRRQNIVVNFLQIRMMRPFPSVAIGEILTECENVVVFEDNYSGQLRDLITQSTGIRIEKLVVKYDGRPFSQTEIEIGVHNAISEHAEKRLVLSHE
tara:strand:- start:7544 stop:9376 length:1833 start_codon:yes stop_codon:yes gene_type:complete